ncbi:MAG: hypothetical protein IJ343_13425 [Clostridia bacterium]|nr:hypothetical protein [Clostridia bacterium]
MKKFLTVVALLCMILTATSALAASVPSKTADDLTKVEIAETETGVVADPSFSVAVTEPTEKITGEVTAMQEFAAQDKPVVEFFPAEVQQEIAAVLPETVAVADVVAYELVPVVVENYEENYGDVVIDFEFATVFPEETEVIVLLGLPKAEVAEGEDAIEWIVKTGVVSEGKISILFTQEELVRMDVEEALLVVMGAPIAE